MNNKKIVSSFNNPVPIDWRLTNYFQLSITILVFLMLVCLLSFQKVWANSPEISAMLGNPITPNRDGVCDTLKIIIENPSDDAFDAQIFDISGKSVALLSSTEGSGMITWDGKGLDGMVLPADVYYLVFSTGAIWHDVRFLFVNLGHPGETISLYISGILPGRKEIAVDGFCFPTLEVPVATITLVVQDLASNSVSAIGGRTVIIAFKTAQPGIANIIISQHGNILWKTQKRTDGRVVEVIIWDGTDITGTKVSNGNYIFQIVAPGIDVTKTVELVR
ncbi:MAG: hypothetical protein HY746_01565 [Elusimicrobia bacterium]|nr:hypothetical protein [Elusimicrobiota bacterium]